MINDIYIFDNIIDSKAQRKIQQITSNKDLDSIIVS